jgi:GT2 family glycosyltransferase
MAVRNAAETIGEQLAALAAQDFEGSWELIVVDNGSTDDTRDVIDAWRSRIPNLRVLVEPAGGYALACNTAVQSASSPRLLFCESDDVVSAGWVRAMVEALEHADVVGGALEFEQLNSPRVRASRNPLQSRRLPVLLGYLPYSMGANLGVARNAFEATGGFDELFSGGGNDVDLCWRVQQLGCEIRFAPEAVVHYRFRSTLPGLMKQKYRYARENQRLFAKFWRMGLLTMRPLDRYQLAFHRLFDAVRKAPRLADPYRRWQVLGGLAASAGRFAGLYRARLLPSLAPRPPVPVSTRSGGGAHSRSPGGSPRPG